VASDSGELLGSSAATRELRDFVRRAGRTRAPVLLSGETGTGKSLVARLIHGASPRHPHPFHAVNCAGIPEGIFEREFFGHRRGAFTGAVESRQGHFEAAHRGTLFLDEVAELPLAQQAKLLTVLEEGVVRRVGDTRSVLVDFRIIAATSTELRGAVAQGSFRADLFHRLALLRCELPPLRERVADIPALVLRFLDSAARRHGCPAPRLAPEGMELLMAHPWPGNVRELAHVVEAGLIQSEGGPIGPKVLARVMPPGDGGRRLSAPATQYASSGATGRGRGGRYTFYGPAEAERRLIQEALMRARGNRTEAARALGMSRNTLRDRMRRYGL